MDGASGPPPEQPHEAGTQYPSENVSNASSPYSPDARKKRSTLIFAIVAASIILLAVAAGAWWWHAKKQSMAKQPSQTDTVQQAIMPDTVSDNTTKQYVSNGKDLNLTFSYPSSWTVSPPSNNNASDGPITVTSPLISTTNAAGTAVTGKVVINIRPGYSDISELGSGNATVAQGSVQFAYSKPTSTQHQYPYLTFIHLAGGTNPTGSFEEVMITGITSFAKDQAITSVSLAQLDPIISAAFYTCTTQTCSGSGMSSLSISNNTWLNDATFKQVQSLFESLQLN